MGTGGLASRVEKEPTSPYIFRNEMICCSARPARWPVRSVAIGLAVAVTLAAGEPPQAMEFRPGSVNRLEDLPRGRFRLQVERLALPARERALAWLRGFHFTASDLESIHADAEGGIYYADTFQLEPIAASVAPPPSEREAAVPISPFPTNLVYHSRPGAPNVLFLNFSGENVSSTAWNTSLNRSIIPAVAFSTDADDTTFSDAEQLAIKRIWQRVAEDYAPFNLDVTTERPAVFGSRTAHALITRNTDANGQPNPSSDSGGVAYVGVFGSVSYATYRPAWIYHNNLANNESYIAESAAHEIGHNLGLSHDGRTDGTEYYGGHGSGDISWGPIMGTGYNRNVSQWSKGDYYLANNSQDDLATIAGRISYRTDDHGNTAAAATGLLALGGTNISSTTPETDPANTNTANKGVLERNTDVDVFSFVTGDGPVTLAVNPWLTPAGLTRGGNLDILLELHDEVGALVATNNPASQTQARIDATLTEGLYYLHVRNSGAGDPFSSTPTGYTGYASIGQYFVTGIVVASSYVIPPQAELAVANITQIGAGPLRFTVTYRDNSAIDVASISGNDVRITGPKAYDRGGRLISVNDPANGTPRLATYEIDPLAGGVWTDADNGLYTILMQSNQVSDIEGAWVAPGALGQFTVSVPRPVYFANFDTNPGWTLEPDWEYGTPAYSSGGPTAGFTGSKIVAYNLSGNYENRLSAKYATTPPIDCAGASTLTLRFRRWLRLKRGDTAVIQISTNGTAWTEVWSAPRQVTDGSWQEIQHALPSWTDGSPSLQLRWGMASGVSQNDLGWNLDDVEIIAGGSIDTTPPTATLSAANLTRGGSPSHTFTVTYTDDTGVRAASLTSSNLVVTGPNAYSNTVEFVGVDATSDGTPRTATYAMPAPGETWGPADNGTYDIVIQEGEVADVFNNAISEALLGSLVVDIPESLQALVVSTTTISVPEGSNATFTVRLAEPPSTAVTVAVARVSGDGDLRVLSGGTLVFDSSNWSNPAPVTLAALIDEDSENGSAAFECASPGLLPISVLATEIEPPLTYSVAASANNDAWGSVNPATGDYAPGSAIQLAAVPARYFQFIQWTGDYTGANNPLSLVVQSNVVVQAVFAELLTTSYPTPLWWLASFGFTNDFETAVTNIGANGFALWQSQVAGLDPNDPNSQLRLSLDGLGGENAYVLNWATVTGRVYSIYQSSNLLDGFVIIPGASNLAPSIQSWTNGAPGGLSTRFHQIEVRRLDAP